VLAFSTDPAHSLGDAFGIALGARPRPIPVRSGRLEALELDARGAMEAWLRERRPALASLIEEGTLLDREDVGRVLQLPLPGIDELAGFLVLAGLDRTHAYDRVVMDTAPTGHTLRLFETPRFVGRMVELFEAMFARHAAVARALGGHLSPNALVEELRQDGALVSERLRNPARTAMMWVTLAEPVTVRETLEGIEWLRRAHFPITTVVINRLTDDSSGGCAECDARLEEERAALAPLASDAGQLAVRAVRRQPREPTGIPALRAIGTEMRQSRSWKDVAAAARRGKARTPVIRSALGGSAAPVPPFPLSAGLVFFGGKGGVGKTTCAAAAALAAARAEPQRMVRLVSTDPAPSLGDVLGMPVGDEWRRVPGRWRLRVRELDAEAVFLRYRERYAQAIQDFFDRLTGNSSFEIATDREVFERLFDLAPPGVDEIVALLSALDGEGGGRDDLLIVDTAPTGHATRLLGLPADVQQWVALLMRLVIKYRLAARAESLAEDLLGLSRSLRALREQLADPARARFVVVVRPAMLPRLETERLFSTLKDLRIAAPTVILNAMSSGTCRSCRALARAEAREAARIAALCSPPARGGRRPLARESGTERCAMIHAPLQIPAPSGASDLLDWAGAWRMG
jgi:arsenite-transporting ATPase